MTKQEFETYRFSIKTLVKYKGEWSLISQVWFEEGLIGIKNTTGSVLDYSDIEEIKEE